VSQRAALLLFAWLAACVAAAELPVPALRSRVTDQAGILAPGQAAALERRLEAFEQRKGSQIAVLIVPSTAPEAIEQYSIRVASAWQLGRKGVDDGALLVVATDDRALRIEVGYGLEGVLTDATSRRIVDEIIVPRFREGDFHGGIDAGVDRMLAVIDGEPLPEPQASSPGGDALAPVLPAVVVFALTLGAILKRLLGQLPGAAVTGAAVGLFTWALVGIAIVAGFAALAAFVLTLAARGGPGRWSSGSGGRSWGGGGGSWSSGGGGFSGGGGSFGGGGSSGRW
jgi:uncharacterized protein